MLSREYFVNNVISNCFFFFGYFTVFNLPCFYDTIFTSKVYGEQLWIRVITVQLLDLSPETFLAATSCAECYTINFDFVKRLPLLMFFFCACVLSKLYIIHNIYIYIYTKKCYSQTIPSYYCYYYYYYYYYHYHYYYYYHHYYYHFYYCYYYHVTTQGMLITLK